MLKRVLVAIDGSDYSWRALEYACSLVKMSGGSLVIMTVAPKNTPVPVLFADGDCMTAQIGNEEPQASSPNLTPTARSLQCWDRRVMPRLV